MHVFGRWEEAGVPRENHMTPQIKQTQVVQQGEYLSLQSRKEGQMRLFVRMKSSQGLGHIWRDGRGIFKDHEDVKS